MIMIIIMILWVLLEEQAAGVPGAGEHLLPRLVRLAAQRLRSQP